MRGFECNKCGDKMTAKQAKQVSTPLFAGSKLCVDEHKNCGGVLDPCELKSK